MDDILMRGISIPRNCFECPLFTNCDACEGHECGCGLLGGIGYEEDISEDRRRDDCPLHELPAHGALIDRDRLMEDGWVLHKEVIRMGGYAIHEQPLNYPDIPVIVPASEEVTNG